MIDRIIDNSQLNRRTVGYGPFDRAKKLDDSRFVRPRTTVWDSRYFDIVPRDRITSEAKLFLMNIHQNGWVPGWMDDLMENDDSIKGGTMKHNWDIHYKDNADECPCWRYDALGMPTFWSREEHFDD